MSAAGASAFVAKPVNVESLREELVRLLKPRRTLRVLVVDDDPHVVAFVQILAGRAGFEASHIQSARDALELLASRTQGAFDVVVSDLNMPGMDGRDLLRRARARGLCVPLYALTAETDPGIHARLREEGFARVLTKPLSKGDLEKALGSLRTAAPRAEAGA